MLDGRWSKPAHACWPTLRGGWRYKKGDHAAKAKSAATKQASATNNSRADLRGCTGESYASWRGRPKAAVQAASRSRTGTSVATQARRLRLEQPTAGVARFQGSSLNCKGASILDDLTEATAVRTRSLVETRMPPNWPKVEVDTGRIQSR